MPNVSCQQAEADAMDGLEPGGSDDEAATAMDVGAEAASSGEEASEDIEDEVGCMICGDAF
jgi:hypothetical protein